MKIRLLKKNKINELFSHIPDNLNLYRSGIFEPLLSDPGNYIEINIGINDELISQIDCDTKEPREVENCKLILEAMGELTPYLARDERLWIYLTHTFLLNYSRKRWPLPNNDEKAINHIKTHFFVMGARGFERDNAASRLWWMAHLCNRVEGMTIGDALTSLLHDSDVRANIIERPTTSQHVHVFSTILKKLYESYKTDRALFNRDKFRPIMKRLNLAGGVKLLGALDQTAVSNIFQACL